jgi:hypothetical protein
LISNDNQQFLILVINGKDSFHILIFSIDKATIFGTVVSTIRTKSSLSKGGGL